MPENKKTMEHEGDGDINYNWSTWNNTKKIGKRTRRLRDKKTSGNYPVYSIIKVGQNTEESPGNLRLAVTQTPVENHQLTLV